ncbi:CHC2 zinc finger domain-containing protein [Segetibacter aerophilus]|uniref:CHC2 zinc finger domain-containing protein n=1 Tax=Segetibacter aerophilus TaxID=670293 RepID=UPI0011BFBFAA
MNCPEANKIDLVKYLYSLGCERGKKSIEDYWYSSPLRVERFSSFKVNKTKSVWYDYSLRKGGNVVDFTMLYFNCKLVKALQKLSLFHRKIMMKKGLNLYKLIALKILF